MSKWHRLGEWLEGLDEERVVIDFHQLAELLAGPVPESATRHRSVFWSNSRSNSRARCWLDAGYRTRLAGLPADQVEFERLGEGALSAGAGSSVRASSPDDATPQASQASIADLVLLGCVKTKGTAPARAEDLYESALFRRRREYAKRSGARWGVLSAEHGLVWPDQVIAPYDRFLEGEPADYRREWAQRVLTSLEEEVGSLDGKTVELHASAAYVEPLRPRLAARGATVSWPFAGLSIGRHLSWYDVPGDQGSRRSAATAPLAPEPPPARRRALRGPQAGHGIARTLTEMFTRGELDLTDRPDAPFPGWEAMPEVLACEAIRELGADATSLRRFCTFVMAMDRARDADVLWQNAARLVSQDPWTIDPAAVAGRPVTELSDALRRSKVTQRHSQDVFAWRLIAESLHGPGAAPAVARAVEAGEGDTAELLAELQEETPMGTPRFPLLRGPKIAPVWVRILAYPGGARITGLDRLPVAVDVQVRKVTEYLGVASSEGRSLEDVRGPIQQLWAEEVEQAGADGPESLADTPAALDPALWFYGKWGCTRCERAGYRRRISPLCAMCRFDELNAP